MTKLDLALSYFHDKVSDCIKAGRNISVITHLDNVLGDDWIVVDHHQIPQEEFDDERVINAWKCDIDGGLDVSAGGMAYLVSKALHKENTDLAWIAVVAALGDRQDRGEKKS